jgi:hypothetical protein
MPLSAGRNPPETHDHGIRSCARTYGPSLEPTARHLRKLGYRIQVPDVLAYQQALPTWNKWTSHLLALIDTSTETILVGHSSASVLVADLATTLSCRCLIMIDGEVPPSKGTVAPIRPALHDIISSLARPRWHSSNLVTVAGGERRAALLGLIILARDPPAPADVAPLSSRDDGTSRCAILLVVPAVIMPYRASGFDLRREAAVHQDADVG